MKIRQIVFTAVLFLLLPLAAFAGDYVIGEGDGLDIAVWGVKELTFTVRVRPDGKITIPGLGEVVAIRQTATQLQASLSEKLKQLVKNPIVTVTVSTITNSKVYVFGGGVKSGVFELLQRATLLQLLCTFGDVKTADLKKSYLQRNGKKIKEDFYKLIVGGDTTEDVLLEPGDSLFIPLLLDKSVYVLGAVTTPKAIEYREGITVMEAILEAGGFTKFASQNDTQIRRKQGSEEVSIPVKAKEISTNGTMSQNVKLKPGDYVIVKESLF
ncbi:MAG TPA: sugar ABC transporter substrate-binding protein [Desulfuromonadales bacterium]|nr:sugar ABC transporter substrate-binding protein [Desulfuromonadales bacterium]